MGCDVHPIVYRLTRHGWWEEAAIPEDGRNYAFFGILAGVRSDWVDTVVPVRGLPADMGTKVDTDRLGDHTFSWFTLVEGKTWATRHKRDKRVEPRAMSRLLEWIGVMQFVADHWELKDDRVRVVFGFDS